MDKIKGLSIGLDLDSLAVERGLTGLKDRLRTVNQEMRHNMSSFDYADKSMKKYETSLDGLNKKLEVQRKTTETAKERMEEMTEEYGEGSRQAEQATREYHRQAAELNNLERHIQRVTEEMKEFEKQQQIQSSATYKMGESLTNFGGSLQVVSDKAKSVGKSLTKSITLPALGVATAIGGITAAFGWDRLVGLDTAQAQLKGLSFSTEEVGRISKQVTNAIQGGMTTMAEGTAVAAGALAAGVKEGKELERYIKLVGDAAVGAKRPVEDMAQIFNRVQGSGRLMTQELNMIEQGMPGFAQAMADHLAGGSLESFRQMVTNGEVGSEEILEVMEGFAGGMAEAYADSWQGMVANTKAYIGIIGENLLGGVFEKSKESISEFIDVLSSDEMAEWAEETGEKIGEAFNNIVDSVRGAIDWFRELDSAKQGLILKLAGVAVAAGPLLLVFGTIGGIVGKLTSGLGGLFKILAPLTTGIGKAGGLTALLGKAFAVLTGPIGITISIIGALVGAFILAYKNSETFREGVKNIIENLKELGGAVLEKVKEGISAVADFFKEQLDKIRQFWEENGEIIMEALTTVLKVVKNVFEHGILPVIKIVMGIVLTIIKMVWENIKGIISGALDVIMGAIKVFAGLFTVDFQKMWEGIKQLFFGAIQIVWNWIQLQFIGRILKGVSGFSKNLVSTLRNGWNKAIDGIKGFVSKAKDWFKDLLDRGLKIFDDIVDGAKALPGKMADGIKNAASKAVNAMKSLGNSMLETIGKPINGIISCINWVLKKLNVPKKNRRSEWTVPQYAHGTDGHPGGLAVVELHSHTIKKLVA